jgi:hypothetical protein
MKYIETMNRANITVDESKLKKRDELFIINVVEPGEVEIGTEDSDPKTEKNPRDEAIVPFMTAITIPISPDISTISIPILKLEIPSMAESIILGSAPRLSG